MIEQDTIRLLRECDAGVKMGIAAIDDVLNRVAQEQLRMILRDCKKEHEDLHKKIQTRLQQFQDEGKNPNPIAKSMRHLKTACKLGLRKTDQTIASLMTDGCNMGVKSLNRYLNQYGAAEEYAKDIAKRLIHLEKALTVDLQKYL